MIIISDCFTQKADEGCIKVAVSLAKRMKAQKQNVTLISYKRHSAFADKNWNLNPLFFHLPLFREIRREPDKVVYIPFASNTMGSILRTFVLSLFSRGQLCAVFAMRRPIHPIGVWLLKRSRAQIIALSKKSYDFYRGCLKNRVRYLKTGVDTAVFHPVSPEEKLRLRRRYHIPEDLPVVFHAGHLKPGRNIGVLSKLSPEYFVLLAVSSVTESERDPALSRALKDRPNTRIIDSYVPCIEELYQLSDVYVFPVEEELNCIDTPLSVLEAAACDLPILTTPYGELEVFRGREGFHFLDHVTSQSLEALLPKLLPLAQTSSENHGSGARKAVLDYDWNASIQRF